jgi:antitoxin component YwqK of YwqJK toxin-antitoxin module
MDEGQKNGIYKNYDREGHLILEGSFMDGKLHGDNTAYYADGTVRHRFKYVEGRKTGTGLTYHANGKIKIREQPSLTGKDWTIEEFTETEKKLSVKHYQNDQPHGTWIFYHEDGTTVKIKENYEAGKLSGLRVEYFPTGKPALEETYRYNLLNGPFKTYYEMGSVHTTGECRSQRKHGLFTSYYPNGAIHEQGEYVADKKHKEWKIFDEEGNLIQTQVFKAGILVQ